MSGYTRNTSATKNEENYTKTRQAIQVLYDGGMSEKDIAEHLKLGKSTVYRMRNQTWQDHKHYLANELQKRKLAKEQPQPKAEDKPQQKLQYNADVFLESLATLNSNILWLGAKIDELTEAINESN